MKIQTKIMGMLFLFMALACSKDDNEVPVVPDAIEEPETPVVENKAPLAFDLIAVTDNAVAVDVLPTFSWNASIDPDGDAVTYDLYLDLPESANGLYAENLTETTFEVTERLGLSQNYIWKVVAKDSKGASVSSATRSFATRAIRFNETAVTDNAEFSKRTNLNSVVFQNKLWVIGNADVFSTSRTNDIWFSEDGLIWSEARNSAEFSARTGSTVVAFKDKLWLIGGYDVENKNDVWFSEDGISWQEATSAAPFTPRQGHTSVVFDDKLWIIGGLRQDGSFSGESMNDVWFSEDGITWSEATGSAAFSVRSLHTSVVFDNKIWVIAGRGGGINKDVWYSADGISWEQATDEAPFLRRLRHSTNVFDNKLWLIGGNQRTENGFIKKNDVWFSEDGISWQEATNSAPFSERSGHGSLVFANKIYVIGGETSIENRLPSLNDVWTFE